MAMHLQALTISLNTARSPPPSLAPATNAGLRPHFNPLALKSSFFSGSLNLLLHPNQQLTSGAARISMRVASKQAYICRDCGLASFRLLSHPFVIRWFMYEVYGLVLYTQESSALVVNYFFTSPLVLLIKKQKELQSKTKFAFMLCK